MQEILVRVVHEVDQVRVIILDRISIEKDVLPADRSIFLLLLNHLGVPLASSIIMRDLGFKLNHSRRRLRCRLLNQVRWRDRPMVLHDGVRALLIVHVVAIVCRVLPVLLV